MDIEEFIWWQERLRARGYEKMSAKTGLPVEWLAKWRRREEAIPSWVRLVFAATYHNLGDPYVERLGAAG